MAEPTQEQLNRRIMLYTGIVQGLLASGEYYASTLETSFSEEEIKRLRKDAQEVYDVLTADKPGWF
jgi:hypothetical protein